MSLVFVSHSSSDRPTVESMLVQPLAAQGVSAWLSSLDIKTASDRETSIQSALNQCDWLLVALTPNSVASRWVKAELDWGVQHREGHVVPVLIEPCEWQTLHLLLRTVQFIDFALDPSSALRKLCSLISANFYRAISNVRSIEEALPPEAIDRRNENWDDFAGRVAALPQQERFDVQARSNERALARLHLGVSELKQQLRLLGFYTGDIDDTVDAGLVQAVTTFQRRANLRHVDGGFGELNYLALEEMARRRGLLR